MFLLQVCFWICFSFLKIKAEMLVFPDELKFSARNNKGYIFTNIFQQEEDYFIVYLGWEKLELLFPQPLAFRNEVFLLTGRCMVMEGDFRLFLSLKISNRIVLVPFFPNHLKDHTFDEYLLKVSEEKLIDTLRKNTYNLEFLYEILGFTIHPYAYRNVFSCKKFELKKKNFILKSL